MGTVLYECTDAFSFSFLGCFLFSAGFYYAKRKLAASENVHDQVLWFIMGLCTAFAIFFGAIMLVEEIDQYNKIVVAYQEGNYQIVEGYVENFHTTMDDDRDMDAFEINGISFEYSSSWDMHGYHYASAHGGVITGDGQHLRIGYITMDSATGNQMLDNVIVYIEALP